MDVLGVPPKPLHTILKTILVKPSGKWYEPASSFYLFEIAKLQEFLQDSVDAMYFLISQSIQLHHFGAAGHTTALMNAKSIHVFC